VRDHSFLSGTRIASESVMCEEGMLPPALAKALLAIICLPAFTLGLLWLPEISLALYTPFMVVLAYLQLRRRRLRRQILHLHSDIADAFLCGNCTTPVKVGFDEKQHWESVAEYNTRKEAETPKALREPRRQRRSSAY
jgi:hypothetical protein